MKLYNRKLTKEEFQIELKKFQEKYIHDEIYYLIRDKKQMKKGLLYVNLYVVKDNKINNITSEVASLMSLQETMTKGVKLVSDRFKDSVMDLTCSSDIMNSLVTLRRKDGYCYEYHAM
jgi:hypothetical protein